MVKIATRIDRVWEKVYHQESSNFGRLPLLPSLREQLLEARIAIVSAKLAYRTESDRWLSLLSKAVSAVEACPEPYRTELNRELMCLSTCEVVVG